MQDVVYRQTQTSLFVPEKVVRLLVSASTTDKKHMMDYTNRRDNVIGEEAAPLHEQQPE
jgi:hypothetical protein